MVIYTWTLVDISGKGRIIFLIPRLQHRSVGDLEPVLLINFLYYILNLAPDVRRKTGNEPSLIKSFEYEPYS